jgi:hypothetical protein
VPGPTVALSLDEIRAVTAYAVACARHALALAGYPPAPPGRGRAGEAMRALDAALR